MAAALSETRLVSTRGWPGPQRSVEALVRTIGADAHVEACVTLVKGGEVDGHIVYALGGPPARWALHGGEPGPDYWLRVWALRGLLWHWDERATTATLDALEDPAWRVREMACRVIARHRVDPALERLLHLRSDGVPRVRVAAERAVARLSSPSG